MEQEKGNGLLIKIINILVVILLVIAIFYMVVIPNKSYIPTLLSLIAFIMACIPSILRKKVSGWVFGILGLILIILLLI